MQHICIDTMKVFYVFFLFLISFHVKSQEMVRVLQPSMYVQLMAGQRLTDTTVRYFLTSKESAYLSNGNTLIADFSASSFETTIKPILDTLEGEWKRIEGSYKLFHIPLSNGGAILGSNGFECDITISSLSYINKEGEISWHLDYSTVFPIDFIDTIGFVAPDVVAVTGTNGQTHYFDLLGTELIYEQPPIVYYNILEHKGFYFGIREDGVYKLNSQFEPVKMYPLHQPLSLYFVEHDEFIVSSSYWSVLLNTELDEVSINFSLGSALSVARTQGFLWFITAEGLIQTTGTLVIQKHYPAEPFEKMIHVSAYHDTVYVGSAYNGVRHMDLVIRKYTDVDLPAKQMDINFKSLYIDTVIREPITTSWLQYTFDSISVAIENRGADTIKSFVINWDWRLFNSFCYSIRGEEPFDSILIAPGETKQFSFGLVFVQHVVDHLDPQFCFWVDFANQGTDINPEDNSMCFQTSFVSHAENERSNQLFALFPNPAHDELFMQSLTEKKIDQVYVYSSQGIMLYSLSWSGNESKVSIVDWPAGPYYIVVKSDDQSSVIKFLKQ